MIDEPIEQLRIEDDEFIQHDVDTTSIDTEHPIQDIANPPNDNHMVVQDSTEAVTSVEDVFATMNQKKRKHKEAMDEKKSKRLKQQEKRENEYDKLLASHIKEKNADKEQKQRIMDKYETIMDRLLLATKRFEAPSDSDSE